MLVTITTRHGIEVYLVTVDGVVHSFMSEQGVRTFLLGLKK